MTVYRITGERDLVPVAEVTATDLPQLRVSEEVIHSQARAATRKALNKVVREPIETIVAAATRLIDAFCAYVV